MLMLDESPFRKALVVACSLPGRLIEVDVMSKDANRAIMWNTWQEKRRKRPRRGGDPFSATSARRRKRVPWMTGLSVGPLYWERLRTAAAESAETEPVPLSGASVSAAAGLATPSAAASDAAAPGAPTSPASPAPGGSPGMALRRRSTGPTLFACCYSIPGIVAFDGTTLLPLGVLVSFSSQASLCSPEGLCASQDSLFVVTCEDCTVARIGLRRLGPSDKNRAASATVQSYGGWLSYGRGVVLATIAAGRGWVGWGLALSPDGRSLFCAANSSYDVGGRPYTAAPPPVTSGNVLCVPLECLGVQCGAVGLTDWEPLGPAAAVVAGPAGAAAATALPAAHAAAGPDTSPGNPSPAAPYPYVCGEAVLRRPSGLCFSPDGRSLWVASYDGGLVELAGPAYGCEAGAVRRVVQLPLAPPPPPPSRVPRTGVRRARGEEIAAACGSGTRAVSSEVDAGAVADTGLGQSRGRGGAGRARGANPQVLHMLAWDLCWVPQGPPAAGCRPSLTGSPSQSGPVADDSHELRLLSAPYAVKSAPTSASASASAPPPPPPLLCVTLHEDRSSGPYSPSGAECRVGVVLNVSDTWAQSDEVQKDPGSGLEVEAGQGVAIRGRWKATKNHMHSSMACV